MIISSFGTKIRVTNEKKIPKWKLIAKQSERLNPLRKPMVYIVKEDE